LGFYLAEGSKAWFLLQKHYSGVSNLFHAKFEMPGEMLILGFLVEDMRSPWFFPHFRF